MMQPHEEILNYKSMFSKISGIVFIIIGLVMIVYTGIKIVTKEKIVDIGPIEISQEKSNPIKWLSILGSVFLVGGILILALDKKAADEQ